MEKVKDFLRKMANNKVYLLLDESELNIKVKGNISTLTEQEKADIATYKHQIIELLLKIKKLKGIKYNPIDRVPQAESYSISDAQRSIWVLSRFEKVDIVYHMPSHIYVNGIVDVGGFKYAISSLIDRHEILRTVFRENSDGEVRQLVLDRDVLQFEIKVLDFSRDREREERLREYLDSDNLVSFDLEQGPLFRASVIKMAPDGYVFYYNMHHIISDGWSMEVLLKDFGAFYESYVTGKRLSMPELRIQYKDYVAWQMQELLSPSRAVFKSFWLDSLSGELPLLNFPSEKIRPKIKTYNGCRLKTYLEPPQCSNLKLFTQQLGGSLFMGLLAVWKVLCYRYTAQEEIIIGSPAAGRDHPDLENQLGCYVNILPLRNRVDPEENFLMFFDRLKDKTIEAYNHQMYPFDRLVEDLKLTRDISRSPVFDVMLALHNLGETSNGEVISDEEVDRISVIAGVVSKYDMSLEFQEKGQYISFIITYNSDVYGQSMVERLMIHFKQLLNALLLNPTEKLSRLEFLNNEERTELLHSFNATKVEYPKDKTIVDLFEEQVAKTPDAIAVVFKDIKLTYRRLNELSNQLADYLRQEYCISSDDLVGVKLDRSQWLIVSILGVLKAGGAYVPIDVEYPQERINYLERESNCKVIIDERLLIGLKKRKTLCSLNPANSNFSMDSLAYVMYTSGSTGEPKGVMIEHKSVVNLIYFQSEYFKIQSSDRFLLFSSISFDASVEQLFLPLLNGAQINVASKKEILNEEIFKSFFKKNGITHLHAVPSFLRMLSFESFSSLKRVISGGDKFDTSCFRMCKSLFSLYNKYGVTESTVTSTEYLIEGGETFNISIGKPIANTSIYILGLYNELLPIGVTGEICIGGAGLARGYLNRPELTKEKFIENPLKKGERLYKTGDLGRWLPDGNIEFIERKDNQVKIRGYRIELGEIEHALQGYAHISSCVVDVKESSSGDKDLVAYFTGEEGGTIQELREHLSSLLPSYMVPDYFVKLEELPLTSNGKLDRKSLPDPEGLGIDTGIEYVAPGNDLEKKLVSIWSDVLGIPEEDISITANFFELGGHSLKVLKLSSRLYKDLGSRVSVQDLFIHKSISSQSILILESEEFDYQEIPCVEKSESYELSSSQRRLWVLSQFESANVAYNISSVHELGLIDIKALESSFNMLIARHESLRTVFREGAESEVRQFILEELSFKIDCEDLEGISTSDLKERIEGYRNRPFDLSEGPLLRGILYRLSKDKYVFVYVMHHIISDGVSMDTLFSELISLYDSIAKGISLELSPLRIQYKDYAVWQQTELKSGALSASRNYWLDQFKGEFPVLDLPTDYARPMVKSYNGGTVNRIFDKYASLKFKDLLKNEGSTTFIGMLSLVNVLLYRYTGQEDIVLGTPVSGREHPDLEGQIGFFVNTIALRTNFQGDDSFKTVLKKVKESALGGFNNQLYPFDELVDELSLSRDTSRHPLFDVMVTYKEIEEKQSELDEKSSRGNSITVPHVLSKFDLTFNIVEQGNVFGLAIEYSSDLFAYSTIVRMLDHFEELLSSIVANPLGSISRLSYLSLTEHSILLKEFNETETEYPKEKTVVDLFEEQVERTPHSIALVFGVEEVSYEDLNSKSNQLAYYLKKRGVKSESLVGICINRSFEMMVGLLGILKAGGAYVPIDPTYPQSRMAYILNDANCELVLSQEDIKLPKTKSEIIYLDTDWDKISRESSENVKSRVESGDLAYVIYTSGSTGTPKGVMIEHGNVNAFLHWCYREFGNSKFNKMLFVTSICFDLSIFEIFFTLTSGKILKILDSGLSIPDHLKLGDDKLFINTVPSVVGSLLSSKADLSNVSVLNMAGEPIPSNYIVSLLGNVGELRNLYGPSEDTTYSTVFNIDSGSKILIGRPISNTKVFIVNSQGSIQPIGIVGEICLSGAGVARGYLNNPTLTAEKFVESPFYKGERLYKTGDLGKWLPDGNIQFIGRKDTQVKIRGYRIELGEIEYALQQSDGVESCCVVVKEVRVGERELIAYYVGNSNLTKELLCEYLSESLPAYMIPSYFIPLVEFPLTSNGKIDKKALPDLVSLALGKENDYIGPRNRIEKSLVEIWSDVLDVPSKEISINTSFFDLGGHSLKAIKLLQRINQTFETKLKIEEIFYATKLEFQAKLISNINVAGNELLVDAVKVNNTQREATEKLETVKIFAIPFAGGNEYSFSNYEKFCPDGFQFVSVKLPGRGVRIKESRLENLCDLRDDIFEEIKDRLDEPYVLYGHSMGAILVTLVAEKIQQNNLSLPIALFVSGSSGPVTRKEVLNTHLIPDQEFLQRLYSIGGYSAEILSNNEFLDYSLPILKSDFKALNTYVYRGIEKLKVRIHVMIGTEEQMNLSVSQSWQKLTNFDVKVHQFDGNHFFIYKHTEAILALIKDETLLVK